MNVSITKPDAVSCRMTVAVVESDYRPKVEEELKKIGRTHTIPGFRKGHVSLKDLERRFGKDVTADVINREVYEVVMKYIEENKLEVLGQPVPVEVKELDFKTQKDFNFEYDLALAPELNINATKEDTLPYYSLKVTDEMVADQDKNMRKRYGKQEPGEEFESDALVKGSLKELDADGAEKTDDNAISVSSAIVAPMYFTDKEQTALFNGKKVGDKVVFNPWKTCNGNETEMSSMLQVDKSEVKDLHSDFELTINEIVVVKPADLNQEFYDQVFGKDVVTDETGYYSKIREIISKSLQPTSESVFRDEMHKYFSERYSDFRLSDEILKKWLIGRNEEFNESNINEEYEKLLPGLKWQLIKEALVKSLEIKIEEEDVKGFAKELARRQFEQYGMMNIDDETLEKYAGNILSDKKYRSQLIEQVGDLKLLESVKNAVTLDVKEVTLDELRNIVSK